MGRARRIGGRICGTAKREGSSWWENRTFIAIILERARHEVCAGAAVGGAVGGFTGGLIGLGILRSKEARGETQRRQRVDSVHSENAAETERAKAIFAAAKAEDITSSGEPSDTR